MLFHTTVRRELARSFGATLVVILTIVLTMMLIRTLGLAAGGSVAPQDVVLLLGYTALGHLPTMLALSLFIAVVATLGRMYRDSEMAIWFASGVGLSRFVRPVLQMSWPVLLVIGLLVLLVWPWGNRMSAELRERYQQRSDLSRVAPGVFQVSRDGNRVFFVERDGDNDSSRARNVFVLSNEPERESVVSAHGGHIENTEQHRVLVLEDGQRNDTDRSTGELTLSRFETYRLVVDEHQARTAQERSPKTLPTLELMREPGPRMLAELAWRFGLLLGAANLLLLGIGLSATNPRRASNWNLLFALLGFVVYYNLINLTQAWVSSGRLGLAGALLGLHGAALVLALTLLRWREQGAAARQLRLFGGRA
ncbi:LPS export ABC transporter permease LptF [Azohydromonas caseinilytica]|uniref:Lipopolysaccharide export system permease protein LptF n=1 Tax=Azohydromonas caseinilytica TaxID=2728836 RepID=A0A848FDS8_9BURK|nr:LPS export ABC transporter permease LptF [Azohydromonas caseinilytica]NML17462.1 LPS export ABC transporter permease LptF [Azohydromonas caseinilytica]